MVHIQGSMGTQWVKCKSDWVIGRQNVPRTGQGFHRDWLFDLYTWTSCRILIQGHCTLSPTGILWVKFDQPDQDGEKTMLRTGITEGFSDFGKGNRNILRTYGIGWTDTQTYYYMKLAESLIIWLGKRKRSVEQHVLKMLALMPFITCNNHELFTNWQLLIQIKSIALKTISTYWSFVACTFCFVLTLPNMNNVLYVELNILVYSLKLIWFFSSYLNMSNE